ncbi:MAG: enoyl-CoA hydratase/isomerase family protein [Rubrivivax sp.]|nr:enoyl-CoA hydratase/isomerase family protein [Rubrivivax sp.]
MTEPVLLSRRHGATAWLTLNRPRAMNALSFDLADALLPQLQALAQDGDVRVLVITGSGNSFCAGADLKNLNEAKAPGEPDILDRVVEVLDAVRSFPKPVIGAVNGLALAGGMELMMCCDLIYAAESARIGDAHCNYGIVPGGGGAAIMPRLLPLPIAKYLLFTGEFLPARKLLQYGLLNEVVPDEQLLDTVATVASVICQKSPIGLQRAKRVANEALDKSAADALRDERLAARDQFRSRDFREGMDAFLGKRKPEFNGY